MGKRKICFNSLCLNSFTMYICMGLFISVGYAQVGSVRERIRERMKEKIMERKQAQQPQTCPFTLIEGNFSSYLDSGYSTGDYRRYINFEGNERFYDLHVPKNYSKDKPMPLVLNFHGGSGNPVQQRNDTEMDKVSDAWGFIVVYPAGTGRQKERFLFWNSGVGNNPAVQNNINDVGFVAALLEDVAEIFNIDQKRIYSTGISNGGFMSYRLACELSDRIAAVAPVAAAMDISAYKSKPTRPIPVIHFHGKQDKLVPYAGGTGGISTLSNSVLPSIEEIIKFWVDFDGCPSVPAKTFEKGAARCVVYGPGRNNTEVILWALEGAGHTWPGGNMKLSESKVGKTNRDISASELIWEFFSKHSLP